MIKRIEKMLEARAQRREERNKEEAGYFYDETPDYGEEAEERD